MTEFMLGTSPVQKWIDDKLPFALFQSKKTLQLKTRGENGSLSPRLDIVKVAVRNLMTEETSQRKTKTDKMIALCSQALNFNENKSARYLVEWRDGKPHKIRQVMQPGGKIS